MNFQFGKINDYDVVLASTLYDWLDLANGKLNPIWGILTKKLKLKGNTQVFNKLIKKNLMFNITADITDPPTLNEKYPIKKWKQPKKILIINGSPRGKNGYTFHYLNRFIQGLEKGNGSIEVVELGKLKINPCTGCYYCWKNNTGRCVQKDDVNKIYDLYNESDLIIYAFTLYWDTVPGILKNFIERAFCLEHPYMIQGITKTRHPRRIKKDKSFFLFSVCGFPEQSHFDSVKEYFRNVSHNAHIPFLGGIYRSACMFLRNDPLYYKTYNQVLDSIYDAGESLYYNGKIEKKTVKRIEAKVSPKEFKIHANKFWEKVVNKNKY
ncbi:MAG: hypothetical protein GY756_25650, partial [bacterium]|nr:hypothetical protein [bacterium]